MRPDDVIEFLRARPFQPFRIHMTDGTKYDIRHPEMVLVGRTTALVCFPHPRQPFPRIDKYETAALVHITRLEPMESPAAPATN